jgi:hypothetical protein
MTSQVTRLYALALSLLVFFLVWATIAAHPWPRASTKRSAAPNQSLAVIQQRLRADAAIVRALSARARPTTTAPLVRVVTLPPLTTTRTS